MNRTLQRPHRLAVFTGAGMSTESGVDTFRTEGGIWQQVNVEDVATPEAWERNPDLVTEFYNRRRKQLFEEVEPHRGHLLLAALEQHLAVDVITQNVDDLHERAGSSQVLHLHGELRRVRSSGPSGHSVVWPRWEVRATDRCPDGYRWRPDVVWFGEAVPHLDAAAERVAEADALLVIGTSLNVYPAAGLVGAAAPEAPVYVIDPGDVEVPGAHRLRATASSGMEQLWRAWLPDVPLP